MVKKSKLTHNDKEPGEIQVPPTTPMDIHDDKVTVTLTFENFDGIFGKRTLYLGETDVYRHWNKGDVTASQYYELNLTTQKGEPTAAAKNRLQTIIAERVADVCSSGFDRLDALTMHRIFKHYALGMYKRIMLKNNPNLSISEGGYLKTESGIAAYVDGIAHGVGANGEARILEVKVLKQKNALNFFATGEISDEWKEEMNVEMVLLGIPVCDFIVFYPDADDIKKMLRWVEYRLDDATYTKTVQKLSSLANSTRDGALTIAKSVEDNFSQFCAKLGVEDNELQKVYEDCMDQMLTAFDEVNSPLKFLFRNKLAVARGSLDTAENTTKEQEALIAKASRYLYELELKDDQPK